MELRVVFEDSRFGTDWYAVQENMEGYGWVNRVSIIRGEEKAHEIMETLRTGDVGFKFVCHNFSRPLDEVTADMIREHFQNHTGLTLYGFASKEEAQAVADQFPKYAKVRAGTCTSSSDFAQYGIYSELVNVSASGYTEYLAYSVGLGISSVNKVTGDKNETGNKRVEAFIRGLQAQGFIN